MLTFLLEEGVISVATVSGIFTATLLGSFKTNILDPFSENLVPNHTLHPETDKKEQMSNILDANNYNIFDKKNHKILWKIFLKDLIIWIIIMFILYLIWNYLVKKIKKN